HEGNDVAPGETGEIAVASPWQMERYVGSSSADDLWLSDGAIRSGDIGHLDERGYLHFHGRINEVIKTGGENVFPAEVERVLLAHPAVSDAAVFGRDDAEWGQRVEAAVVMAAGCGFDEDELKSFCRERLAGYKVPKRVRALPELPYT